MNIEEIALHLMESVDKAGGFLDGIRYDVIHGEWIEDFKAAIEEVADELGEGFLTEDFCSKFASGEFGFIERQIEEHPVLSCLDDVVGNYEMYWCNKDEMYENEEI